MSGKNSNMRMLLNNMSMEFDGDIIITDPCYILRDESHRKDWDDCDCGYNLIIKSRNPISFS